MENNRFKIKNNKIGLFPLLTQMNRLFMSTQILSVTESLMAHVTFVGFLSRVAIHMIFPGLSIDNSFTADLALELSLRVPIPNVLIVIHITGKVLAALVARHRFVKVSLVTIKLRLIVANHITLVALNVRDLVNLFYVNVQTI